MFGYIQGIVTKHSFNFICVLLYRSFFNISSDFDPTILTQTTLTEFNCSSAQVKALVQHNQTVARHVSFMNGCLLYIMYHLVKSLIHGEVNANFRETNKGVVCCYKEMLSRRGNYTPSKQSFGVVYRNRPVSASVCLSIFLVSTTPFKVWTDTDETSHSCSIRPEDVHEGG